MSAELSQIPPHVPADRVIDFDAYFDPAIGNDVHKWLARMRDSSPSVGYSRHNGGHWVVFGGEELRRVLSDTEFFSSRQLTLQAMNVPTKMIPLQLDPPEHAPYRHMLLKHLGPKEIRELEPFVRSWAERLISKLEGKTECDFIHDVSEPMPISVFMVLMGFPLERFDEFRGLAVAALSPSTSLEERPVVHMKIMSLLAEMIDARRNEPRDDLISKLLAEQIHGRPLTHEELFSTCYLLFLAGLDTVTNAMGYGMRHLASNPELQTKLRANPEEIPAAVEELLRRYTFVNTVRVANKDTELGGVQIREGEALNCVLWGGSNDSAAVGGTEARQMAFGAGPHTCLGMYLARLELRVMYETWFSKIGSFALSPKGGVEMHGGSVMGIKRLPLVLEPLRTAA